MLRHYVLREGLCQPCDAAEATILWFCQPDEGERRYLTETLQIDEHTLESALDPDEPARLEIDDHFTAMIFKRPRNYSAAGDLVFRVDSVSLFLFKDKLVILSSEDCALFDRKTFKRTSRLPAAAIRVIARSVSHFNEHLKVINMISEELEGKINTSMENRYLINLFSLEKSMIYYLAAISSNGALIEKLRATAYRIGLEPDDVDSIEDLAVDNSQCYRQAEIYSNVLAGMSDARASIVANNLNQLMKLLNIITIGIMVPTFVVSAFSMNVRMPFNDASPWWFWIILGLAAGSLGLFYWLMKRLKW